MHATSHVSTFAGLTDLSEIPAVLADLRTPERRIMEKLAQVADDVRGPADESLLFAASA